MKVTPSFRDLPTSFLKNGHIVAGGRKPEKADFTINLLFSVMICVNCELEFIWHSQLLTSLTTSQAVEQKLLWYLFGRHRFASLSGQPLHFRVFLQSFSKKKKCFERGNEHSFANVFRNLYRNFIASHFSY